MSPDNLRKEESTGSRHLLEHLSGSMRDDVNIDVEEISFKMDF